MSPQPYNILPPKRADRIAKTFYHNKKGEVRWWDGKQLVNKENQKKYRADNKEKKKAYQNEYYKANKEKLKEYYKKYNAANKEKKKEYNTKYNAANKEKKKEDNKKYNTANKEKKKEDNKKYNTANKEKKKEYNTKYNAANKEKNNKRCRNRYKNDENFKLRCLLRNRFSIALKSQTIKKNSHVLELTSCTVDVLKNHLSNQFEEGMTWANHGDWHIDHRRPCASFDLAKEEEQRKCFHYTNLQPLWEQENREKSAQFNEATFEYAWTTAEQGWVKF